MTNNVKAHRESKGWTQQELSGLTGVPQPTISSIECGAVPGAPDQKVALSRALMVSVADLFPVED